MNDRPGDDALFHKRMQTVRGHVSNSSQSNPPNSSAIFLRRDAHDRFVFRFPAVNGFFGTAQIGLIHLDAALEAISPRPHHRTAQLMVPSPSCLVAAQSQNTLQAQRISSRLLTRDIPHRLEPHAKWLSGTLKNRSRSGRRLPVTLETLQLASGRGTSSSPFASRSPKALGPPHTPQIRSARFVRSKPIVELLQRSGVVHAADGVPLIMVNHTHILYAVVGRGKWISTL